MWHNVELAGRNGEENGKMGAGYRPVLSIQLHGHNSWSPGCSGDSHFPQHVNHPQCHCVVTFLLNGLLQSYLGLVGEPMYQVTD